MRGEAVFDKHCYNHVGSTPQGDKGREFFNLVLQSRMTQKEKADLVEFLRVL